MAEGEQAVQAAVVEPTTVQPTGGGEAEAPTPQDLGEAVKVTEAPGTIGKAEVSMFGEEAPSEAELMGAETPDEKPPEKKAEEPPVTEKSKEPEEPKKAEAEAEKKAEEAPDKKPEPPPKGFVPLQALHEERGKRQFLEQEIIRLKRENEVLSNVPIIETPQDIPEDFKVLTDAEEDALMQEDVIAYQKYTRDLRKYNDFKAVQTATEAKESGIVEAAMAGMEAAVPGIFDEKSNANKALTGFAAAHGLPPEILSVLTDPKTKLIIPGQKQPVLMGKATVDMLKFLRNTYMHLRESKPVDKDAVKKEVESTLRETLTKEITQEIMGKLKTQTTGYRGIDQVPGSGDIPRSGPLTEAEMAKMTPEQTQAALGG